MVGGLKYENKRLRIRWYLSDSLYTTEANVRTTEVSKKIPVTKWNIRLLSDCKIKQPVNMISGT